MINWGGMIGFNCYKKFEGLKVFGKTTVTKAVLIPITN
jgi:hypothetical protein